MAQLFNDTPDRQDLGAISIGSRSRQILKKKFRKNIKSSLSYENFKISKVGDFFFHVFLEFLADPELTGIASDQLGVNYKVVQNHETQSTRCLTFLKKVPFSKSISALLILSTLKVSNRLAVKSKVALLDK